MRNNILIIIVVTLVAVGVIAAVIFMGLEKDKETSSSASGSIPNWGGVSQSSELAESSSPTQNESSSVVPPFSSAESSGDPENSSSSAPVSSSDNVSVSSSDNSSETPPSEFEASEGIIATASSLIGVPFVLGGADPDGFDNPGFIYYVLRENGFHNCTRSVAKQSQMGRQIGYSELKAGDLVFFTHEGGDTVGFGGIYIGDGKMIASLTPSSGDPGVMIADITLQYYRRNFYCGVSLS